MKLSSVPVVPIEQDVLVPNDDGPGHHQARAIVDVYDFGPDARGHEEHVLFRTSEFTCDADDQFNAKCEACVAYVTSKAGPLNHLRESRGIEVEAR